MILLVGMHPLQSKSSDWSTAYHLFQMRWEPGRLTYYIDNVQTAYLDSEHPVCSHVSDAQLRCR